METVPAAKRLKLCNVGSGLTKERSLESVLKREVRGPRRRARSGRQAGEGPPLTPRPRAGLFGAVRGGAGRARRAQQPLPLPERAARIRDQHQEPHVLRRYGPGQDLPNAGAGADAAALGQVPAGLRARRALPGQHAGGRPEGDPGAVDGGVRAAPGVQVQRAPRGAVPRPQVQGYLHLGPVHLRAGGDHLRLPARRERQPGGVPADVHPVVAGRAGRGARHPQPQLQARPGRRRPARDARSDRSSAARAGSSR